jgi:hypothetical protein
VAGWASPESVRRELAAGRSSALARALSALVPEHAVVWMALDPGERRLILAGSRKARITASAIASTRVTEGDFAGALAAFDDLVTFTDLPTWAYCNALYAVMDDNSHLGVMAQRARHYLPACLPHGSANPAILFNAACVYLELGDVDAALDAAADAVRHGYSRTRVEAEAMLAPLRSGPGWARVADALPAWIGPVEVPARELRVEQLRGYVRTHLAADLDRWFGEEPAVRLDAGVPGVEPFLARLPPSAAMALSSLDGLVRSGAMARLPSLDIWGAETYGYDFAAEGVAVRLRSRQPDLAATVWSLGLDGGGNHYVLMPDGRVLLWLHAEDVIEDDAWFSDLDTFMWCLVRLAAARSGCLARDELRPALEALDQPGALFLFDHP